jgi:glucose-6-phosphate isomerase
MKLEFYNCPKPQEFPTAKHNLSSSFVKTSEDKPTLPSGGEGVLGLPETPEFVTYKPDFDLIKKISIQYQQYPNILIIAHGGSLTSFYGYYYALKYQAKKQAYFLNTVDPDYIYELKQKLKPENTLVISISKSGENTTHLEMTAQFLEYPMVVVTGQSSPLRAMAEKLKLPVVLHPDIGGRYTGLTEVALLPAGIVGLNAEGLFKGAQKFYDLFGKENLAWKAASVFYQLEEKGYVDVFMPFYAHNLFPMSAIIVQLCHESFGKDGKGQTYFAHEAPESQHHTNQRFFGGRKNIAGFFTSSETFMHPADTVYPPAVHSVQIKGHHLADINKIPLQKALQFEMLGTLKDARIAGIPAAHMSVDGFTPDEIGQLVAFWQLYAVYSSVLRQVDPFDQPQVENSKNISFGERLAFKGLL